MTIMTNTSEACDIFSGRTYAALPSEAWHSIMHTLTLGTVLDVCQNLIQGLGLNGYDQEVCTILASPGWHHQIVRCTNSRH